MQRLPLHEGTELPLATDVAILVMAFSLLVLGIVAYDAYRAYDGEDTT
jgi:hypothetical protein